MKDELRKTIYDKAKEWIIEAGAYIRDNIHSPITINTKTNRNDLVTTMDQDTEKFFAGKVKKEFPDHFILGEEGYGDQLTTLDGTVWIIDPIDGTMNFVHQKRNFAISIGIYHEGIGEIGLIYDVMSDHLYSAIKGQGAYKNAVKLNPLMDNITLQESILGFNHRWLCENRFVDKHVMQKLVKEIRGSRTFGSAALEFAYVAEGILDGYLAMRLAPWDVAAGIIIVNEVGGITTNQDGKQIDMLNRNIIVTCNHILHKTLIHDFLQKGKK